MPAIPPPERKEIDHRTMKLIVGVIAISLPVLTSLFSHVTLDSISASYWAGGLARSIFIGFLFAIASFLLAYNGYTKTEMVLSKVAALAGLAIAVVPCGCDGHDTPIPDVHFGAAALMFVILAFFCYGFYFRARVKGHAEANARAVIYAICGGAIVLSIVVLALNGLLDGRLSDRVPRLVFYGEATGLMAFGISWLIASRTLPGITRRDERFSPLRAQNPAN